MSFKRFGAKDLIYSTLVAKPAHKFVIHSGSVYKGDEILLDGDFSNKIKHIEDGEISLHEMNINRPSGSLVYSYIEKGTTRYANRTISTSEFDDIDQFSYGAQLTQSYPMKAGLSRIFVDSGPEFSSQTFENIDAPVTAAPNKKYIRALNNVVNSRDAFGQVFEYGNLGTKKVNMVCAPGIFYGSAIDKGSIELNYYITGTLVAQAKDSNKDGILVETLGPQSGSTAGVAIYEQGILLLTGSWDLSAGSHTDQYFSPAPESPSWLSFGTGLPVVGEEINHSTVVSSSYSINFKGTNKNPTLTMFAFAEKGRHNFSTNPSFLTRGSNTSLAGTKTYTETLKSVKNIAKSDFVNFEAPYKSITYISKVGIYDENENLIAVATLANPVKKTADRDYMIKMRLDF